MKRKMSPSDFNHTRPPSENRPTEPSQSTKLTEVIIKCRFNPSSVRVVPYAAIVNETQPQGPKRVISGCKAVVLTLRGPRGHPYAAPRFSVHGGQDRCEKEQSLKKNTRESFTDQAWKWDVSLPPTSLGSELMHVVTPHCMEGRETESRRKGDGFSEQLVSLCLMK